MAKKNNTFLWVILGIIGLFIILIVLARNTDSTPRISGSPNEIAAVNTDDWVKGNPNAAVELVEYGDFQCPACAAYSPVVSDLVEQYGDRVAFVYRHFPLTSIHPNAFPAARAAEAAGMQGKFFEYHDILFERQREWSGGHGADAFFVTYAEELELDIEKFTEDYRSDTTRDLVRADNDSATKLNLRSTPSFLLNGQLIQAPNSLQGFGALLDAALANTPVKELTKDDLSAAEDVHEHADFAVYLAGEQFDFSADKYQSDEPAEEEHDHEEDHMNALDPYVHIHNNVGHIIHKHKRGVTLGYFFKTLGMEFTDECFKTDDDQSFCSDETNSLKFFVNGARNDRYASYEFQDEDQILISYGPLTDSALQTQLSGITDEACIYSETCPERGTPPEEKCVGGLGSNCTL